MEHHTDKIAVGSQIQGAFEAIRQVGTATWFTGGTNVEQYATCVLAYKCVHVCRKFREWI